MEPRVNKILKKLSNEKIKLATENVELTEEINLSLKNADSAVKFIQKNQLAGKNLGKKIESARVKLAQAVNEAKSIFKEMEDVKMELPSALSELIKIKNTLKENGIPTDAVDGRAQVLQTYFNIANKTSDTLSRSIGDSTNGIK
jgi:cysteinyl-tRNA synthetase